jgi:hypothetical protein
VVRCPLFFIDISQGGIGCTLPEVPRGREVFLHFDEIPNLYVFAILARVVRSTKRGTGGWDIGASFRADQQ